MKEKTWKGLHVEDKEYKSTLANVLYWYSLHVSDKQKKDYFLKYCKTHKIRLGAIPDSKIGTVGSVSRLIDLGFPFKKESLNKFKELVDQLVLDYPIRKPEKNLMKEIKTGVTEALTIIDTRLDQIFKDVVKDTSVPVSMPKLSNTDKLFLVDYYTKGLEEINIVLSDSCPDDLKEAYVNSTKWTLKRVKSFYENVLDSLVEKSERKARKKKIIPVKKLIAGLKYKIGNDNFKSINPEYIVGSAGLLVFNDKYNTLTFYEGKLSVKGTSITGYDKDLSYCKHINDLDHLRRLILADFKSIKKRLTELPKDKPLTSRIGENSILLKSYS